MLTGRAGRRLEGERREQWVRRGHLGHRSDKCPCLRAHWRTFRWCRGRGHPWLPGAQAERPSALRAGLTRHLWPQHWADESGHSLPQTPPPGWLPEAPGTGCHPWLAQSTFLSTLHPGQEPSAQGRSGRAAAPTLVVPTTPVSGQISPGGHVVPVRSAWSGEVSPPRESCGSRTGSGGPPPGSEPGSPQARPRFVVTTLCRGRGCPLPP